MNPNNRWNQRKTENRPAGSMRLASILAAGLAVSLLPLAACRKNAYGPVALLPEDVCAMCKMAISEKRFAAEFIDRDGQALKFDDIGCMIHYIKEKQVREQVAAIYLTDFETRQWVRAEEAHCVQSEQIKSPMSGGIIAFKDPAGAEAGAATYRGKRASFADLLSGA